MPSRISPHVGIRASLPVAVPNRAVIPAYNTTAGPRVQVMAAIDTARPRAPVHSGQTPALAERGCNNILYNVGSTSDLPPSKMAAMHAQMWQQNRQFNAQSQNCRLQPQPMSAYMTQQQRMQAPGCGTLPDWSSRFNSQSPYQQSERLPHHHHHQQQQQRLAMPSGTMIRQQLPTYQNVVDQHLHQDMMKHTWHQQQQHLLHLQSMSQHHRYVVASVAGESCDVGGFRPAASSNCVMAPSSSSAVSSTV